MTSKLVRITQTQLDSALGGSDSDSRAVIALSLQLMPAAWAAWRAGAYTKGVRPKVLVDDYHKATSKLVERLDKLLLAGNPLTVSKWLKFVKRQAISALVNIGIYNHRKKRQGLEREISYDGHEDNEGDHLKEEEIIMIDHNSPSEVVGRHELYEYLYDCLECLPQATHMLLYDHYWRRQSFATLALNRSMDVTAVRRQHYAAINELRRLLWGYGIDSLVRC